MKSTIQKSLYTLFLASYIFSASCFANETPKENNQTSSSSSKKKKGKNLKKYFLFSLPLAAMAATYMFSKRSDTPNNNGGGQIPPSNNNENKPSNNNGGGQIPPSNNNKNKPSKKSGGGQIPPSSNNGGSQIPQEDQYVKEVKDLLTQMNYVDETDDDDKTLLYKYLERGHKEAAKYLIDQGAKVDRKDGYGKTLLYQLLEAGNEEAAKYLIENNADVSLALRSACQFCQKDMVNALLESYGADATKTYNFKKKTLLHIICGAKLTKEQRKDAVDIIKLLVDKGVKIDATADNKTALSMACSRYYYDLVEELIIQGADVTLKSGHSNNNLLIKICRWSSSDTEEHKKTIQVLLKHLDINDTNDDNVTALHMACEHENKEIVEELINQGAKLNAVTNYGNLPIHYACKNYNALEIVKLLIEKNDQATEKFALDKKNNNDETPLYIAASYGKHETLKELIKELKLKSSLSKNDIKEKINIHNFLATNRSLEDMIDKYYDSVKKVS